MPEEVIGHRLPVLPHTVVGSHDDSGQAIMHVTALVAGVGDLVATAGTEPVVRLWTREGEPAGSIAVDGMPEALSTLLDSHLGVGFLDGLAVFRL